MDQNPFERHGVFTRCCRDISMCRIDGSLSDETVDTLKKGFTIGA